MHQDVTLEKDVALTKSGQITLPADIAKALGAERGASRLSFKVHTDGSVTVERQPTFMERMAHLHSTFTPEQKKAYKKYRNMTPSEIREEYMRSPRGQRELKERYGL